MSKAGITAADRARRAAMDSRVRAETDNAPDRSGEALQVRAVAQDGLPAVGVKEGLVKGEDRDKVDLRMKGEKPRCPCRSLMSLWYPRKTVSNPWRVRSR